MQLLKRLKKGSCMLHFIKKKRQYSEKERTLCGSLVYHGLSNYFTHNMYLSITFLRKI